MRGFGWCMRGIRQGDSMRYIWTASVFDLTTCRRQSQRSGRRTLTLTPPVPLSKPTSCINTMPQTHHEFKKHRQAQQLKLALAPFSASCRPHRLAAAPTTTPPAAAAAATTTATNWEANYYQCHLPPHAAGGDVGADAHHHAALCCCRVSHSPAAPAPAAPSPPAAVL